MDLETSRTQNRAHNIIIYMLHPHHQFKQKPSSIAEINPSVNHSTGEESSTASSEQKRSLTPLQYVVGQRASHDLRRRLLQPDKTRTKPSDIKKSTQHPTSINAVGPTESNRMPHLAERVVLLLQPLQAALLGHGETLTHARTRRNPSPIFPAHTHAAAGLGIRKSARESNPVLSQRWLGGGNRARGPNWGQRRRRFGGLGRRERGGEGIGTSGANRRPRSPQRGEGERKAQQVVN
jgi:hypothetical protein